MRKFVGSKTVILILGGLSILVIIYLIASLGGLELKPAKPFAYLQETEAVSPAGLPAWNYLGLLIVFFGVFLIILYFLLPPDQRKRFLWALARLALAGIIIFLILSKFGLGKQMEPPQATPGDGVITLEPGPTATPELEITPAVFTPPQVSSWIAYLVALGFLLVVASVWGWLVWRKRKMGAPYDTLAEIARSALDDIEAGKDWGDTILNSYYRMNKAVADWRGIHRQAGMTPAEFADDLVSVHLPHTAVFRLTVLFERVRYGNKKSTRKDLREAVDCLTAILDYCRGAK
ncbi:MAG: DUF4129 domain-containing protein [Chloroflexi bacterium]|nr:DUF4129 domain-containing protein [Chloroflexota bacterium]